MTLIDISVPLRTVMPTWPGGHGYAKSRHSDIDAGDATTVSIISMDVHAGSHIDAPAHFVPGGATLGSFDLDTFIGPVFVADLRGLREIGADALSQVVPNDVTRLLMRTDNSELWESPTFEKEFAALNVEGAQWLTDAGVQLVGNDYLSIQLYGGDPRTHTVLMEAGVAIIEGLDLRGAPLGWHDLILLPLNVPDLEAAPLRAVLRVREASHE